MMHGTFCREDVMPIFLSRRLTGRVRTRRANYQLAGMMAVIAGATNAGGFLAVAQYTSHMTGILSTMADNIALYNYKLALSGMAALLSFIAGSTVATLMIHRGRRLGRESEYAAPLMLEALLLLCFGSLSRQLEHYEWLFIPLTVWLLCFVMGLQNALITVMSQYEIRTTHITGMVTDIGIEVAKLCRIGYHPQRKKQIKIRTNSHKLLFSIMLVLLFLVGGVIGAYGFRHVDCVFTILLAAILMASAAVPIVDDIRRELLRGPPRPS
jgi:uncharacterized membrane protein YoaK (UPF0700 family)